jgi:hypothetical protein
LGGVACFIFEKVLHLIPPKGISQIAKTRSMDKLTTLVDFTRRLSGSKDNVFIGGSVAIAAQGLLRPRSVKDLDLIVTDRCKPFVLMWVNRVKKKFSLEVREGSSSNRDQIGFKIESLFETLYDPKTNIQIDIFWEPGFSSDYTTQLPEFPGVQFIKPVKLFCWKFQLATRPEINIDTRAKHAEDITFALKVMLAKDGAQV